MKLTERQVKIIIKEELDAVTQEGHIPPGTGPAIGRGLEAIKNSDQIVDGLFDMLSGAGGDITDMWQWMKENLSDQTILAAVKDRLEQKGDNNE